MSTSLAAGTYSVRIIETADPGCEDITNTVTIEAPEVLELQLTDNVNANCNITNAIVTVQATGGTAPYTYGASLRGAGIPSNFLFDTTVELDPATSLDWDIYVRDDNGCIIPVPLEVTIAMDSSPDISIAVVDDCVAEGNFEVTVSLDAVNTGVAPYRMRIGSTTFQNIASFPFTYTNLNAGPHSIEIRDANGCGEIENITIFPELIISAVPITQPTCATNDGVIEFATSGGNGSVTVTLLNAGTLTDTGISPTGNQFTGVGFGDYIVRVTDTPLTPSSCTADAPVSLEEPSIVRLLDTDWTDVTCAGASDGSITINMESSSLGVNDNPPYTFEITDGTSTFTQDTNLFTGLPDGIWNITVTSNRSCIATDQVTISEPTTLAAAITNVTPFS